MYGQTITYTTDTYCILFLIKYEEYVEYMYKSLLLKTTVKAYIYNTLYLF
jgi:hypothetical protein